VRVIEDLHMRPEDVRELGFRLLVHWSDVPAVSAADAHALVPRQRMAGEQHDQRQRESAAAQQQWHKDRAAAYRTAMAAAVPASGAAVSPRDHASAKVAGLRAMLRWEKAHDPTSVGLPAGLRTDAAMVEQMSDALDGAAPAGQWHAVGV
jgi:hypothetical protein